MAPQVSSVGGSVDRGFDRGVTLRQTEIDFGTTPVGDTSFTVVDRDVQSDSRVIAYLSYDAPTGKDQDELEMDAIELVCTPGGGSFTMFAVPRNGYVADKFKVNYLVG